MENKYTDDEWIEIRSYLTMNSILSIILDYQKMYVIPNQHQKLFKNSLLDCILNNGPQESVICNIFKDIKEVVFGDLKCVPLFLNSYPEIVAWRLSHRK